MLLNRWRGLAPAVVLFLGACSAARPAAPASTAAPAAARKGQSAKAAIAKLADNYQTPRLESFLDLIDENRFPNYDVFSNAIRVFQIDARQINLDVIVDAVDHAEPDVNVRAHWNKSWVDSKGPHQLSGSCELLLDRQPSGRLLLAAIRGASPF